MHSGRVPSNQPGAALTAVLVVLTFTTGVIEAVSFLVLGQVFTAMMTGNLLFLAFGLGGGAQLSVAASSVSLAGFAAGALAGAVLEGRVDARRRCWFVTGLATEGVLLGAAGLAALDLGGPGSPLTGRHYTVIALTALAMGLRSITTLRAHVPDLPTTLATRTLTALLSQLPARHPALRRTAALLAMFTGGLLGAVLLTRHHPPSALLLGVGAVVLLAALGYSCARLPDRS